MGGYARLEDHRSMLFDEVRNSAYGRAIAAAVTPDSVVVDLGAGLGLHGLLAARAGARKVYLVEPEPIIEVTRRVVAANGLKNVELLEVRAEELELAEPVDLLISVFTGNFLLAEDLLPSLFVARDRCLRVGGHMIPDRVQMQVAPVSAGAYYQRRVGCWDSAAPVLQGLDYSAARGYAANTAYTDSAEIVEPELLASASTLLELDLLTADNAVCHHGIDTTVTTDGICHGWLGWFRMRLGDEWLSTSPEATAMHWNQVLLPLDPPLSLAAGDSISLNLQRPQYGDWVWRTRAAAGEQWASTFFAAPPPLGKLHKWADHYQPTGTAMAEAATYVLSCFDGTTTAIDIAAAVFSRWPAGFRDADDALRFVRRLVEKYG